MSLYYKGNEIDINASGASVFAELIPGGMNYDYGCDTLTYDTFYNYRKSAFMYSVHGGQEVKIKIKNPTSVSQMRVYYYTENNGAITYLSSVGSLTFDANGVCRFTAPTNAKYFRFLLTLVTAGMQHFYPAEITSDEEIEEKFLPNIQLPSYGNLTFAYNTEGDNYTSGQMILPPNYSVDGKKVPLYVVLHGTSSMNTWEQKIGTNSGASTKSLLQYMANEGFAVFDCYPFTSEYYKSTGQIACASLPMIKRAFESGIEFVCSHYNVDINQVFFSAFSLGGQLGYYFAGSSPIKPKGIAMLAPSIGFASVIFRTFFLEESGRQLIVDALDLSNEENVSTFISTSKGLNNDTVKQFVVDHLDKFAGLIGYADNVHGATREEQYEWMITGVSQLPQWMQDENIPAIPSGWSNGVPAIVNHPDLSKYEPVPMKYWATFDDVNTSTHANYTIYKWLKNGGTDVQWRTLPNGGGGHHAIDTSSTAEKVSGTTRQGVSYSDIPVAYKEMADFFFYQIGE